MRPQQLTPLFATAKSLAGIGPRMEILLKKAIWVGMGVLFCTALSWLISAYDATLVARYTRKA